MFRIGEIKTSGNGVQRLVDVAHEVDQVAQRFLLRESVEGAHVFENGDASLDDIHDVGRRCIVS